MREITTHNIDGQPSPVVIWADDPSDQFGRASHKYIFQVQGMADEEVQFQHGPIAEFGINGISNEALLAILIDRLEGFQSGPFWCQENERALESLRAAMNQLKSRTLARIARGVEGTNVA